jgi:hypothetical protein
VDKQVARLPLRARGCDPASRSSRCSTSPALALPGWLAESGTLDLSDTRRRRACVRRGGGGRAADAVLRQFRGKGRGGCARAAGACATRTVSAQGLRKWLAIGGARCAFTTRVHGRRTAREGEGWGGASAGVRADWDGARAHARAGAQQVADGGGRRGGGLGGGRLGERDGQGYRCGNWGRAHFAAHICIPVAACLSFPVPADLCLGLSLGLCFFFSISVAAHVSVAVSVAARISFAVAVAAHVSVAVAARVCGCVSAPAIHYRRRFQALIQGQVQFRGGAPCRALRDSDRRGR